MFKRRIIDKYPFPKILLMSAILLIVDQITKIIFTNKSYLEGFYIFIRYSVNYGSTLNLFSSVPYYQLALSIISIFIVITLFYSRNYFMTDPKIKVAYLFLISGIIGNTIDRLLFGYVRDFIGIKNFFIFNFADLYLTIAFLFFAAFEISEANKNISKNKKKKLKSIIKL